MEKKKCDAYNEERARRFNHTTFDWEVFTRSQCFGTPERSICTCGGDESKCDFYPEKRHKKEEIIKALKHDRDQYEKGYKDGYDAAMKAVWELVEKHLDRSV